jgi:hypothetical protein
MKKQKKFKRAKPRINPKDSRFITRVVSHKKKKASKEFCRKFKQSNNEDN